MDTRQNKKSAEEIENQSLHKVTDENYIIKTDKIQADKAFKEAVIFNLVKKLDSLDHLKKKYNEQLDGIETYPSFIKYYVHLPYLVPVVVMSMGYMKYKKVLTWNTGLGVVCFATILSEFNKAMRMKRADPEMTKEYEQYSANYSNLMSLYVKNASGVNIFKYMLGVNVNKDLVDWKKVAQRDDLNNEYQQSLYY